MARPSLDLVDPRIAKALSHPMRARILGILDERVASPNEISEMIDERLPERELPRARAARTSAASSSWTPRSGAGRSSTTTARSCGPSSATATGSGCRGSGRQAISDAALKIIWEDVSDALKAGTFESRPDRHLSHNDVVLDDEGWKEVAKLLSTMIADVQRIAAASAKRLKTAVTRASRRRSSRCSSSCRRGMLRSLRAKTAAGWYNS